MKRGIYLVGGYPDRETFRRSFRAVAEAGFEFIEVGIPYNDPLADGPVISEAALSVLSAGISVEDIMADVQELSGTIPETYVMTYTNIIDSYGVKKFSDDFASTLSGAIIADLPNRMREPFVASGFMVPVVPFATLETRLEDLELVISAAAPFIYYVALRGITGSKTDFNNPELRKGVEDVRSRSKSPVVLGFGIKTPEDAASALSFADGFVIGTEAVARQKDPEILGRYCENIIKSALI